MEPGLPLYRASSAGDRIDFASASTCRFVELLRYRDLSVPLERDGDLDDTSLTEWFTKDLTRPSPSSSSNQAPAGGLRLLLGICNFDAKEFFPSLSFRKESFTLIKEQPGLPPEFLKCITGNAIQAFKFSKPRPEKSPLRCFVFKLGSIRTSFYQLAISYNRETGLTYGLILTKSLKNVRVIPRLLSDLQKFMVHCERPSLLAVVAIEQAVDDCNERINISDEKLSDLEETMGQHEYEDRPKGNPLELDFVATTSALNHISKRLGADVSRLGSVLIALEKISEWVKEIAGSQDKLNQAEVDAVLEELSNSFCVIDEKISYLTDYCRILGLRAEYEEKRTRSLIQVVYQFMAQRDAKVNIELAKSSTILAQASTADSAPMRQIAIESKKDSSAMKTIAILGMFFLPGTFIAAIFAMPLFNWDNDGSPVVKDEFKYYLAVAMPLTFLVFIVWATATLLPWRTWISKTGLQSKQYNPIGINP